MGRTARAGRGGLAVSFVTEVDSGGLQDNFLLDTQLNLLSGLLLWACSRGGYVSISKYL